MSEAYSLPIADSPIHSYSNISFAYSILKANAKENFDNILCDKYVTYFFDPVAEFRGFSLPFYNHWYGAKKATWLQEINLLKETYESMSIDPVWLIKQCLLSDNYVHGRWNGKIVDTRWTSPDEKWQHDFYLITGFNDRSKTFSVQYFDSDLQCQCKEIDYVTAVQAMWEMPNKNVIFCLIKYNHDAKLSLDLTSTISELEGYVQSRNTSAQNQKNIIYGMEAGYAFLRDLTSRISRLAPLYPRAIFCLDEHKTFMLERIQHLTSQGIINPAYLTHSQRVSDLKDLLMDKATGYNSYPSEAIGKEILSFLQELLRTEQEYLPKVLDELKAYQAK